MVFPLSGALFPLSNLPGWLSILTKIDPATYAVDALRSATLGIASYSFVIDIEVLAASAIGLGVFGGYSFGRMKAV
ncbi:MAG: ABC transporter permease [Candidatus Nitrosopolaris sp.]